jgi:hypothetical protein
MTLQSVAPRPLVPSFVLAALLVPALAVSPSRAAESTKRYPTVFLDPEYYRCLLRAAVSDVRPPEIVQMVWAVTHGSKMGPGEGWFHEGLSRYSWTWLARRHGIPLKGRITRKQFKGPAELFDRLDRNRDAVLTADDFDWSGRSPFLRRAMMVDMWFYRIDTNSNGRISRAEWDDFFIRAAKGKNNLTRDDFRDALTQEPPKIKGVKNAGPTPRILIRGLFQGELGSFHEGPSINQQAPDFTLPTHDGKRQIWLSRYRGDKPIVLIFGSFT